MSFLDFLWSLLIFILFLVQVPLDVVHSRKERYCQARVAILTLLSLSNASESLILLLFHLFLQPTPLLVTKAAGQTTTIERIQCCQYLLVDSMAYRSSSNAPSDSQTSLATAYGINDMLSREFGYGPKGRVLRSAYAPSQRLFTDANTAFLLPLTTTLISRSN